MSSRGVRWGAVAAALVLALPAAGLWWIAGRVLWPPWYTPSVPAEQGLPAVVDARQAELWIHIRNPRDDLGYAYEDVAFPAVDGSTLRGWLVPGAAGATAGVVTVHGGGGDRRDYTRSLPLLHQAGYPVLLFDCREHGTSDGRGRGISFGVREHRDVSSAVAWLRRERGLERVAVVGGSQGGASVILAAAVDPGIDVVVAESAFTSVADLARDARVDEGSIPPWLGTSVGTLAHWRAGGLGEPSPLEAVPAIAPRPLLLLHGTADPVVPYRHSERLFAAAGDGAELWLAEGAGHIALFNRDPERYRSRVVGFLERHLGPAVPSTERFDTPEGGR